MPYVLLSHKLNEQTPTYMSNTKLIITPINQISKGDSANTFELKFGNHIGTHADCQKHFIEGGKGVAEYDIEDFIFNKILILKIKKGKGELFFRKDFENFEERIKNSDFIIIKTEFQIFRNKDPYIYQFEGPGFSSEAASYLANFENIRGIGFDFISLSSPLHREEGRKAHRILLSKGKFIIVEDMNLEKLPSEIKKLYVIPLFIEVIDSSPCTVFAEF
ncbi:MAG: cyclase family protein [Thermoproteota archaeon]|jgi:kynurenine formamidase|nr:cyclase family protein [Thermoproteota archaeon]